MSFLKNRTVVGVFCILLSLLYRLTPAQCRMILVDPKVLELKSYDDIPHLLSPVVTEPAKAVRALKWAVEEMERRYRQMSEISVRNLSGFNEKVRAAQAKGGQQRLCLRPVFLFQHLYLIAGKLQKTGE